ncbi:MAG: sigma-70 family RNA polymerase sigma factor [Chloroflexi bacterium]|nr:sigma-70 family RNA polymerase sigma factor [Chloroflexota bacterium]
MLLSELYQKSNDKRRFLQRVDLALQTLKDQERKIIELRYGLTGKEPMTLQQIGTLFDLSRERIRQLEARALRKLRHPSRLNRIRDLL